MGWGACPYVGSTGPNAERTITESAGARSGRPRRQSCDCREGRTREPTALSVLGAQLGRYCPQIRKHSIRRPPVTNVTPKRRPAFSTDPQALVTMHGTARMNETVHQSDSFLVAFTLITDSRLYGRQVVGHWFVEMVFSPGAERHPCFFEEELAQ